MPAAETPHHEHETLLGADTFPTICTSLDHFRLIVRDDLHRWNDLCETNTYLLSLDGLSGVGKSTLTENLHHIVRCIPGVDLYRLAVDRFIATPRDSLLRRCMTDSRASFWKLIYDRQTMIDVAKRIVQANGAACSIPVATLYNRENGSVGQGMVSVPPGRKVVLMDGIDSTRIQEELSVRTPSCPQMRVFVYAHPHVALERAAKRDTKRSLRTLQEGREYRRREFQYLVPQIIGQNMGHVDIIYMG